MRIIGRQTYEDTWKRYNSHLFRIFLVIEASHHYSTLLTDSTIFTMEDSPSPLRKLQDKHSNVVDEEAFKLAPFNPSSDQIQEKALELLQLQEADVLFDLGCGDGRLLCTAVEKHPGLRCVGIEIDPVFVERAQERIQQLPSAEMQARIDVRLEDALKVMEEEDGAQDSNSPDTKEHCNSHRPLSELTLLDDASALYLFIVPKGIQKLMPILLRLVEARIQQNRPFRILSYMFKIHEWEPTTIDKTAKGGCPIYYYEWKSK